MAGNGVVLLQVSPYSLAGISTNVRKTIVEGQAIIAEAVGSLATITVVAGGTGFVTNDQVTIPGVTGGVGTVTASGGVVSAVAIASAGYNGAAVASATAAPAILPSAGVGLTVTTTITAGALPISLTSWAIASNVLTFQGSNSLTTGGGQSITVTGYTGTLSYLNGTYTTTSATASTIVVAKTAPNASGTTFGLAVLAPNYTTGGLPINYSFINLKGGANPIGGIGPLSVPSPIQFTGIAGSAFSYPVNTTVTPNLMKILSGITEVTNGTAVTADTIRFRAEFATQGF